MLNLLWPHNTFYGHTCPMARKARLSLTFDELRAEGSGGAKPPHVWGAASPPE